MKSILGIGNALTDILAVLPDDTLLKTFHLPLGSMQHVDRETGDMIWNQLKTLDIHYVAGGSAANTIACTAVFGMPSGFIGKIGDDELGLLFKSDQEQYGVNTLLLKSPNPSGRSMVFVSGGNAERTFAVYLGAALDFGIRLLPHRGIPRAEPGPHPPRSGDGPRSGMHHLPRHGVIQCRGVQRGRGARRGGL